MSLDLVNSIKEFLPEIVLVLTFLILPFDKALKSKLKLNPRVITICGFSLALLLALLKLSHSPAKIFQSQAAADPLCSFAEIIALSFTLIAILAFTLKKSPEIFGFSFFVLPLTLSCILIAGSINFVTLFVSLTICDASVYYLLSTDEGNTKQILKFSLFSLFSSVLVLFGSAILFGITGSFNYYEISYFLSVNAFNSTTMLFAVILIVAGFASKTLIAPFHFSAKTLISNVPVHLLALITGLLPVCGFAGLARFLITCMQNSSGVSGNHSGFSFIPSFYWNGLLITLSAISIVAASISLIRAKRLRLILFNLSVIQTSLLILGLASLSHHGFEASLALALSFLLMNIGFSFVIYLYEQTYKTDEFSEQSRTHQLNKYLVTALLLLIASFAGLPLTIGFPARLAVYYASIGSGEEWNLMIQIVSSIIVLFTGFRMVKSLLSMPNGELAAIETPQSTSIKIILLIICITTILGGIYFAPISGIAVFFGKIYGI